ncbi:MAG: hypothetical protein LBL21_03965, partial [Rickettsiales bacterium]|nr:hypothetical protein [Rickettsiales bacterium]
SKGSDRKPTAWTYGTNCWCNVTSINNKTVSGAWIFDHTYGSNADCYAHCALNCSNCVRYGVDGLCSRSALFTAL